MLLLTVEVLASSEPREFNVSSSGLLTCSATFSGPERDILPYDQFPRLGMMLDGSVIDNEMAPLEHTHTAPMHYMVRVCVHIHVVNTTDHSGHTTVASHDSHQLGNMKKSRKTFVACGLLTLLLHIMWHRHNGHSSITNNYFNPLRMQQSVHIWTVIHWSCNTGDATSV